MGSSEQTSIRHLARLHCCEEREQNAYGRIDPIRRAVEQLSDSSSTDIKTALREAVEAAKAGAESTKMMKSTFGRSAYVGQDDDGQSTKGLPDPGALSIVAILEGILAAL